MRILLLDLSAESLVAVTSVVCDEFERTDLATIGHHVNVASQRRFDKEVIVAVGVEGVLHPQTANEAQAYLVCPGVMAALEWSYLMAVGFGI